MAIYISTHKDRHIGIIKVEGEVDMFTSPDLRNTLVPFFEKEIKGIIVDLAGVSFMDSSGIATLVEGLQWSRKENKPFLLTGLGINVMNALCLTKLDKVFSIRKDTEAAYKEFY